jgi:hypothetical protein
MKLAKLLPLLAVPFLAFAAGAGPARSHDEPPALRPLAPAAKPARSLRVQLLAHVAPGGGYSGDVFGHRGHAYLSSWRGVCPAQGVRVYDVRNPRRPVHVSTFADRVSDPSVQHSWTEKTIVRHVRTPRFTGELAVTSFQACRGGAFQGFGLYDVTNPSRPRTLALVRLEPRGSHEIWLQPKGSSAYVYTAIPSSELVSSPDYDRERGTARTPGKPDFRIFDVSDPEHPVQVGEWGAWKSLGVHPREGRGSFLNFNFVHSVIVNPAATRAYLSYWDLGTVILDITRPEQPRYLGRTRTNDPEGDAHSAALARGGRILIETHESVAGHPTLFDVSNPRRPRKLSDFTLPRRPGGGAPAFSASVHDPKVRGNRAYFSWYQQGVVVADISNPRKPRLIARFVPRANADPDAQLCRAGERCTMTWGVYPERNYVLASDMISGLWILRLTRPSA